MFTQDEAKIMLALLNRVSLNGQEAETVVYLKNKLAQAAEPKEEKKKEEKK